MPRKKPSSADKDRIERVCAKLRAFGGRDAQIGLVLEALALLADRFPEQALAWIHGVYEDMPRAELARELSGMTNRPVKKGTAAVWKTRAWEHLWQIIEELLDAAGEKAG